MDYLDFLSNGGTDFKGRTLDSIWSFTDQQIESTHDFVQIIFPLDKPSQSTFHGYYLDSKDIINKIKDSLIAKDNILKANKFYEDVFEIIKDDNKINETSLNFWNKA
jgi:hypothetical protein